MKLRTKPQQERPKEGATRHNTRFAWWPKHVENKVIWLEKYRETYVFITKPRVIPIGSYPLITCGGWDLIKTELL